MQDRKLYKVKVATDLMVMAVNKREADEIAKKNASHEIGVYGECSSSIVKHLSDIPSNWKEVIPYAPESVPQEARKCSEIFVEYHGNDVGDADLEDLVEIQKKSKPSSQTSENKVDNEVVPETRPDPKPRDLEWKETKSGRPLPPLRFNIMGKR